MTPETPEQSLEVILQHKPDFKPRCAIIIGSGLAKLTQLIEDQISIPYEQLPGFPISTVKGHAGELILGKLKGTEVVCMSGRGHFYEGYGMQVMNIPVRTFKQLGCEFLLCSNAAGSLRPERMGPGSIAVLTDHINLLPGSPLVGTNNEKYGDRFFTMANVYDKSLRKEILEIAQSLGVDLQQAVFAACTGPNFETPAEIRMLQIVGADAVGMSVVPEVICAAHCGLPVLPLCLITNLGEGLGNVELGHEETLTVAKQSENQFLNLVQTFFTQHFKN